jgi:hypothetical protein
VHGCRLKETEAALGGVQQRAAEEGAAAEAARAEAAARLRDAEDAGAAAVAAAEAADSARAREAAAQAALKEATRLGSSLLSSLPLSSFRTFACLGSLSWASGQVNPDPSVGG